MVDPTSMAGKITWLRGKDQGASGSTVSSWADQSGLSRDVTLLTGTAPTVNLSTPAGGKAVNFVSGNLTSLNALRTTGDPSNATASSQYNAGYRPGSILRSVGGDWASSSATMPQWWQVRFYTAKTLTDYTITTSTAARSPAAWTFQGSNDGSAWTTLDTRSGVVFVGGTAQTFTFTNTTAYLYYRLNITAIAAGGDLIYLTKISFTGVVTDGAQPTAIDVWMVVQAPGTGVSGSVIYTGQYSGTGGDDDTYLRYSDGNVYDSFVHAGVRPSFSPTVPVSSWRILRMSHDGTTRKWYLDNALQFSDTPGALISGPLVIGRGGASNFVGNIAEILVRSQIATTTETADLITYFNTEHGLSVSGGSAVSFEGWGVPI